MGGLEKYFVTHLAEIVVACFLLISEGVEAPYLKATCTTIGDYYNKCFCIRAVQVRLAGDTSNSTGRVEIFYQGQWCTVNPYYMKDGDVKVICRMLGYENSGFAVNMLTGSQPGIYGYGTGKVISQDFGCTGTEQNISQCAYGQRAWSTYPAYTYPAAAISCEGSKVRLVDGDTASSGRVEVYVKGDWHTICDSGFDTKDAIVICRMLGFEGNGVALAFKASTYGQGFGDSAVTGLACNGHETDIKQCKGNWISACNHVADAGVKCGGTPIRLVGGPDYASGRVEIKHAGKWGTICSRYTTTQNSDHRNVMVICNMLGYNYTGAFGYKSAFYGEGDGYAIAEWPSCDGSEYDIAKCPNIKFGVTASCSHANDIGVNCKGKTQIRLIDGVSEQSGRVEIFHNGHWGTVGSQSFDRHDLKVICKMMGYEYSINSFFYSNGFYGQGSGEIVYTNLRCSGIEDDVGQCDKDYWPATKSDNHNYDVGVNCDGRIPIRLVGGLNNATGRVEVLHNGRFGTVCDYGFGRTDLIVICRMLGFDNIPAKAYWHTNAYFGRGLGEIVVSHLNCNGAENSIGTCPATWPASASYCTHSKDVSISCDGTPEPLRLVEGPSNYSGRVEILHNGSWGRICAYNFEREDAVVLCRILGFKNPESAMAYPRSKYGVGKGTVVATNLHCMGLEETLEECQPQWLPGSCSSSYGDVGVDCCPTCSATQIIG